MDTGHLHLMLNHLPVLGVPALLALLVWGLAGNMPTVARGALWLTLALAAVTAAVYLDRGGRRGAGRRTADV